MKNLRLGLTRKFEQGRGFGGQGKKKYQLGLTIVEISLALILSAIVAAATIQAKVNEQRMNSGVVEADALKQLKIAVDLYAAENRARIARNEAGQILRPNGTLVAVPNGRAPTVADLINGELLRAGFPAESGLNGGQYVIALAPFPAGCTPNTCGVEGVAYIDEPLLAPSGVAGEYDGVVISAILSRIGGDSFASVVQGGELVSANGVNAIPNPAGNVLGTVGIRVGIARLGSAQFDNIDVFGDTNLNNLTTTGTVAFNDGVDAAGNPVERTMVVNTDTTFNDSVVVSNTGTATFDGTSTFNNVVTFNNDTTFNGNNNLFRRIRVSEELISEGTTTTRTITVNDAGGNPCIRLLENGEINILCDGILEAESGTFTFDDTSAFQIGQGPDGALGVRMLDAGGGLRAELFSSLNPTAISVSGGQVLFRDPDNGALLAAIDGLPGRQGNLIARQGLGGRAMHLQRRVDGAGVDFVAGDTCPADMNTQISLTAPFNGQYGSFIVNNSGTMLVCQNDNGANRLVAVGNEMVGFGDGCVIDGQIATLRQTVTVGGEIFRQGEALICRTAGTGSGFYQAMKNSVGRIVIQQPRVVVPGQVFAKPTCAVVGGGARGIPIAYLIGQTEASADAVFERRLQDNGASWTVIGVDGDNNSLNGEMIIVPYCVY